MASISIEKTNKGGEKLFIDGYFYHLERVNKNNNYNWCCAFKKTYKCKSRVVTKTEKGSIVVLKSPCIHNHEPKSHDLNVTKANNTLKSMANSSFLCPSQIIQHSIINTCETSRDFLPSKDAQNVKIKRVRKANNTYIEPKTIDDIDIPLSLYTAEGALFILSEVQVGSEYFITMGTKESLNFLAKSDFWIMDGTFAVVPSMMRQLFSIHGKVEGVVVPLIFCLMTKKSKKCYESFFNNLKYVAEQYKIVLKPKRIMCDFEIGISKAAQKCFPSAVGQGCFFHFSQIIWRKIQKEK